MKGTTLPTASREGTPGYPAPESAWYVETKTCLRPKAWLIACRGAAMPVEEQLALVTMYPPLP